MPDRLFHLFSHFADICILNPLFGIDGSDAFIPFQRTSGLNDIIGHHLHIRHLRTVTSASVWAVNFNIVAVTGNRNAFIRDSMVPASGVEYRPFKGFRTINIGNERIAQYTAAVGLAFTRLSEDHLYWLGVASRWLDENWFANIVDGFFGFVPGLIRGFASRSAQKEVRQTLRLQGLGRHTLEQQKGFARRDLQAISDIVSRQHYIVGGRLTVFDFVVARPLSGFMDNEPPTWSSDIANSYPNLREYVDRVENEIRFRGK